MKKNEEAEDGTGRREKSKEEIPPPSGGDCGVRGPCRRRQGGATRTDPRPKGRNPSGGGRGGQLAELSTPSTDAAVSTAKLCRELIKSADNGTVQGA